MVNPDNSASVLQHSIGFIETMDLEAIQSYTRLVLRVAFVTMNNLYCIPTYVLWMFILWPMVLWNEDLYWRIERKFFRGLLGMVAAWSWTAGYIVEEIGEDVSSCYNQECLIVVNHQSTADVPLLMAALRTKATVVENMMWLMDRLFKFTNFGIVSVLHGDFFIRSGKNVRESEIQKLKDHLIRVYSPRRRKWLVLFPEGGFLRKRKETSHRFAKANNLPHLDHVSLPRLGAMYAIVNTLNPVHSCSPYHNFNSVPQGTDVPDERLHANHMCNCVTGTSKKQEPLKWVIDITIGYPNKDPLDLPTICSGSLPPRKTFFYYRRYPIEEVPRDLEGMTSWMFDRWFEKEQMLDEFYKTGVFPIMPSPHSKLLESPCDIQLDNVSLIVTHILFVLSSLFHYHMLKMIVGLIWG